MAKFLFNPITGQLDQSGGGSSLTFGTTAGTASEGNHTHAASAITSGTLDNARINFAAPPSIGSTTRNSGAFTTLSAAPTSGSALTLTGGTVTASAPVLDATQTWNNGSVSFIGLRVNVTNTNSATASVLASFEISGVQQAFIRRDGRIVGANVYAGGAGLESSLLSQGVAVGSAAYIGFCSSTFANDANGDLRLFRDAANVLAQRNAANAQTFRLYSTHTSTTSFERLNLIAQTGGSFIIGTEKGSAGGTARNLEFQTDGTTRLTISTDGSSAFTGNMTANNVIGQSGAVFLWATRTRMYSDADGRLRISNNAQNDFDRLQFGGTTSSFPALKRSSTTLQVRLADDSAFAPFACAGLTLNGNLDASTRDIVTDTTTGTKIGTATTQKIGFFNATPVVQQAAVADATDAASTQARLNDLLARLRTLGLIAT